MHLQCLMDPSLRKRMIASLILSLDIKLMGF